jgi:hypothetical protein
LWNSFWHRVYDLKFLTEGAAAIKAASMIVPWRSNKPGPASNAAQEVLVRERPPFSC